jgi:hypothetical protein
LIEKAVVCNAVFREVDGDLVFLEYGFWVLGSCIPSHLEILDPPGAKGIQLAAVVLND